MQRFAKNYIDKAYGDVVCHVCKENIASDNTTLKSIISGKIKYGEPICDSCSNPNGVFYIRKSSADLDLGDVDPDGENEEDDMEQSIGSESTPNMVYTVMKESTRRNKLERVLDPSRKGSF
jgi:hypothetical protein